MTNLHLLRVELRIREKLHRVNSIICLTTAGIEPAAAFQMLANALRTELRMQAGRFEYVIFGKHAILSITMNVISKITRVAFGGT